MSAPALSTPRVNAQMMSAQMGKKVILAGKVVPSPGGDGSAMVNVQAADGTNVTVQLQGDVGDVVQGAMYEFQGTVSDGGLLLDQVHFPLSENFDLGTYNKMLLLAQGKYGHLFWS